MLVLVHLRGPTGISSARPLTRRAPARTLNAGSSPLTISQNAQFSSSSPVQNRPRRCAPAGSGAGAPSTGSADWPGLDGVVAERNLRASSIESFRRAKYEMKWDVWARSDARARRGAATEDQHQVCAHTRGQG